jgi:lambda family phage portal protein
MALRNRLARAWAALRGKSYGTRMYAAARASRLTGDWVTSNTSADAELSSSLTQLRSRSRALCRDVSYAKRAKQLVVNNVIGTGIGMQAQVYTTRDELNARVNDEIEAVWKDWCYADTCHTGGRLDFAQIERFLMAQVFEAGEVLIRKHYRPFGKSQIPFALEVIEAERIADDMFNYAGNRGGKNEIRMGVELDEFHRPVAYYLRRRHLSEIQYTMHMSPDEVERVPADQIIHLAMGDRWPQTRGEPWMSAVIRTAKDMAGYLEAEITRARTQASVPWTIETPESAASFGVEQSDGSVEMTVEAGVAKRLNPGEKMSVPAIGSPNPQVEPFMRYLLRDFASGMGLNYASLSGDYSQSNYSSSRLALLDDRDVWRAFQSWFMCSFRGPIHREWMQQAVLSGSFKTFSIESWAIDRSKFEAVRFRPRGWGWVDPTKEVEAFKDAVRCGFMSMQDVVSQSGADIEEIFDQREKEIALAEQAGLVLDTDPANEIKAAEAAKPEPPEEKEPDAEPEESEPNEPAERRVFSFKR